MQHGVGCTLHHPGDFFGIVYIDQNVRMMFSQECPKNEIYDLTILRLETRVGGSRASQKVTFVLNFEPMY